MNFSYLRREPGFYRRVFTLALASGPSEPHHHLSWLHGYLHGGSGRSGADVRRHRGQCTRSTIIQLIVFGLQSGSRVLISQFWGRGDRESINRVMGIGFFVAGGISTLCALTMGLFPRQVLMLITDNARLVELGTSYIRIVGFSYILNSLSSIYIGMQQSIRESPLRHDGIRHFHRLQHRRQLHPDLRQAGSARTRGSPAPPSPPSPPVWWNLSFPSSTPCTASRCLCCPPVFSGPARPPSAAL